jgi:hypothetical protein
VLYCYNFYFFFINNFIDQGNCVRKFALLLVNMGLMLIFWAFLGGFSEALTFGCGSQTASFAVLLAFVAYKVLAEFLDEVVFRLEADWRVHKEAHLV